MSYHTWSIDGFGIIVDHIETDMPSIMNLLSMAPKFKEEFLENIKDYFDFEEDISELSAEDIFEYEDEDGMRGLGCVLRSVILEAEGIELCLCDDFDGKDYLMYCPTYPWRIPDKEKELTEENLTKMFQKYVRILTKEEIEIDFLTCENGG